MAQEEATRQQGVVIPQEIIDQSTAKKQAHRTLRQLPLYRDMSNLKYMVVRLYDRTPKRLTKYIDSMLGTVCEAKKCVGLGESSRDPLQRMEYLSMARIFVEDTSDDVTILSRLNIVDKKTEQSMKKLAKGIVAQTVAWRDYTNNDDE